MQKITTIIPELQLYYAKLDKPVNPFGTDIYDIQLRFPANRTEEMSKFGKVRQVEDGQFAINVTRKAKNAKGQETKVRVVDQNKNNITDLIGNGSIGNVMVYQYPWEVSGKTGIKTVVLAIQVTKLLKYEPEGVDFDVITPTKKSTGKNTQVDF